MYHPSRGGVRGGRDQFNWDDVKADKHRENYLGHSVKAPVGRWQKGKDLSWYAKDNKSDLHAEDALKAEIQKIKEEEEQAMREALGLAPKHEKRVQGNRLDKRETAELLKRGKSAEDLPPTYAEGERIQGLGFAPAPRHGSSKGTSLVQSEISERVQEHLVEPSYDNRLGQDLNNTSNASSDLLDLKMRKKFEKKEVKEKRKEEKRAAKKAAKMEKKRHNEDFSEVDRDPSRKRGRRRHGSNDGSEE